MYKSIIPGLVSFDTELEGIKGFEMCQDFNFYSNIKEKNKFHYKIVLNNNITIPQNYDFRSEYFLKKGSYWYYERKIFFWHPKFKYDIKNHTFYFNKDYALLPFRLGGMFIIGEHLSNIIELDLFLNGYVVLRGMAVRANGKNIGLTAPGFNGKTTLLKKILRNGGKYLAEDYLIINLAENKAYPSCPLLKENFWQRRKINNVLKELLKKNSILENPAYIDNLYLIQNSESSNYETENKQFIDFVLLNSLHFLNNLFLRSYIFEQGLTNIVFDRINNLKTANISYKFIAVKNFSVNL